MRFCAIVFISARFAFGQTAAPVNCAIDGIVVNALSGEPVQHAQVVAGPDHGASTDAAGRWTVASLPCNAAYITVDRAGFLETTDSRRTPAHDVRIRLTPEAAVFGKVLDEAGDPIAGAEVQVFDSVVKQGRRVMRQSTSVNVNGAGEYRIGRLAAGRYIFCAHSSRVTYPVGGGNHLAYGKSCYPASSTAGAGSALRMEAGSEARADFHLPAVPGVHVRGTISGVPEGARIVVQIADAPVAKLPSQIALNNRFDFAGVVPGSYAIEGLAMADGKSRFAGATVNVGSSDVEGVVLAFVSSINVTGVLRFTGGKLPDSLTLNVVLIPSDPGSWAGEPEWDATRTSFVYSAIAPGKYRVNASAPPAPYYIDSVRLHGREVTGEELALTESTGPIEVLLRDDCGRLDGSVADADGKPAPAQIMLLRGNLPPETGRSGEDGRFTMANLPPGDYVAYAFDDARNVEYAEPEWMQVNANSGVPVNILPGSSSAAALVRMITAQR
jgi:hypothetical protein